METTVRFSREELDRIKVSAEVRGWSVSRYIAEMALRPVKEQDLEQFGRDLGSVHRALTSIEVELALSHLDNRKIEGELIDQVRAVIQRTETLLNPL